MNVKLAMIVAVASNGVIGKDNQLPWVLPGELQYFKATTMGKPIIMGRKTYESLGRPLPGRTNIVVTRQPGFAVNSAVKVVNNIDKALKLAQSIALDTGVDEMMVIGGTQLYSACLPQADRLYVTEVHADIEGDAFFPAYNHDDWIEESRKRIGNQQKNDGCYDYSLVVLRRKTPN